MIYIGRESSQRLKLWTIGLSQRFGEMHWSLSLLQDSFSMKVLSEVVVRNREAAHDATSTVWLWTTKALQPTTDGHEASRENITMPTFKLQASKLNLMMLVYVPAST